MLVEVCANSLESALHAQEGGADRIELCSELGVGGLTPSFALIKLVKQRLQIPVHVLIRPRSSHFCYSNSELEVMEEDIVQCKAMGVEGVVVGALNPDFTLNFRQTEQLRKKAGHMKFTFHRAFDWVSNPMEALGQLEDLGVDYILTSGQQTSAEKGLELLGALHDQSKNCTIMAGGGVNLQNVQKFKELGLGALHLSGTHFVNPVSLADKIPMNSVKHLNENQVAVTNAESIRQIVQSVK